jgi:transporter, major facilitator family
MEKNREQIFLRCCLGYFFSGMATLIIGATLPHLMKEIGLDYIGAGSILTFFYIGNFFGSFLFTALSARLGDKFSITLMTCLSLLSFVILINTPPLIIINILMLILGLTKGSITLFNNYYVNNIYENPAPKGAILNAMFATGAFISPFLLSFILYLGFNWRYILWLIAIIAALVVAGFFTTDNETLLFYKNNAKGSVADGTNKDMEFIKDKKFYINTVLLFFYLGFEYSVNGWFITYLKDTGIMSVSLATTLVSITWIAILISRLFIAKISQKISPKKIMVFDSLGLLTGFIMLISTKNVFIIVISLFILGLFMAPVFPLSYAVSKESLHGSAFAMTMFTALAAIGGIITPYILGVISNTFNMSTAVFMLIVNAILIFILSCINYKFEK